jgi:hypothetical protein
VQSVATWRTGVVSGSAGKHPSLEYFRSIDVDATGKSGDRRGLQGPAAQLDQQLTDSSWPWLRVPSAPPVIFETNSRFRFVFSPAQAAPLLFYWQIPWIRGAPRGVSLRHGRWPGRLAGVSAPSQRESGRHQRCCALGPGGVGLQHRVDTVAVFLRDQQDVVASHETPTDIGMSRVVSVPIADSPRFEYVPPPGVGIGKIEDR